jgi:hypothetical protein
MHKLAAMYPEFDHLDRVEEDSDYRSNRVLDGLMAENAHNLCDREYFAGSYAIRADAQECNRRFAILAIWTRATCASEGRVS